MTKNDIFQAFTAVGQVLLDVGELGTATFSIWGTFVGTIQFEYSIDGQNYQSLPVTPVGGGAEVTNTTVAGQWIASVAGFTFVRARVSGFTSGTINAAIHGVNISNGATSAATSGSTTTNPAYTRIQDGVGTQLATVAQFHNADNQALAGTSYGLLTGGVAQLLNPVGNLDRARGTGFDAVPAVGLPAGTQQLTGGQIQTTFGAGGVTGSATAQSVLVASSANAKVGDIIITQDNVEYVEITAIADGTHVTGIFKNNHASGQTLSWFHYNQARDATVGDSVPGTGLSPSATYLYNQVTGNFEFDRSANGEKDGASGQGTAVAAEYEWNGNPLANGSVLSNSQFDRARNVQAMGLGAGSISNNPLAANSTTLTLNSGPTTLQAGQEIILDRTGANPETNYVGTGYTPGSTTVPLQIATQFSHAQNSAVEWDQHATLGPGLNGFLAHGIGIEEEALYDPVSQKFYIERSATGDGVSGQNVVMENNALYNGATLDRQRGNLDNITIFALASQTTTQTGSDQTNYNHRGVIITLDLTVNAGGLGSITLEIDYKDPVSGKYVALLTGAALAAVATTQYTVYPGATVAANLAVSMALPRTFRVKVTANNANPVTYSVGASLIV